MNRKKAGSQKNKTKQNKRKRITASSNRFCNISEEKVDRLMNDAIPQKTKVATNCGIKIFNGKWE